MRLARMVPHALRVLPLKTWLITPKIVVGVDREKRAGPTRTEMAVFRPGALEAEAIEPKRSPLLVSVVALVIETEATNWVYAVAALRNCHCGSK